MIAISAAHLFCFSNILQLLAGCGGGENVGSERSGEGPHVLLNKRLPGAEGPPEAREARYFHSFDVAGSF